jgi:RHS repeat-associated protein
VVASQRFASLGALFYGENQMHAYDSAGRETSFTSATQTPSGGGSLTIQTISDGVNNIRQLLDAQGNVLQIMNVNPVNEPLGDSLHYGSSPSTGIRTRDFNFIYQWDGLKRLRVVRKLASPNAIVSVYTYDAQPVIQGGRRVQKTVSSSGAFNGTTRFYYDRANTIEETTVSGGNEQVARQFILGTGPDEVFAMNVDTNGDGDPDALYFHLRDHNNNTTQLLAVDGSNAVPYELYSYNFRGAPAVFDANTLTNRPSSAAGNPYPFTGQRYDAETGLYYCKARYYDPYYGVFLSRDPLGALGRPAEPRQRHGVRRQQPVEPTRSKWPRMVVGFPHEHSRRSPGDDGRSRRGNGGCFCSPSGKPAGPRPD